MDIVTTRGKEVMESRLLQDWLFDEISKTYIRDQAELLLLFFAFAINTDRLIIALAFHFLDMFEFVQHFFMISLHNPFF